MKGKFVSFLVNVVERVSQLNIMVMLFVSIVVTEPHNLEKNCALSQCYSMLYVINI